MKKLLGPALVGGTKDQEAYMTSADYADMLKCVRKEAELDWLAKQPVPETE